jgi:uncharacterized protein YndB with AHSA1/START domain
MAQRSIKHAGFVIERSYDASPAEVFAAWADPAAKARWFSGPEEWEAEPHELDLYLRTAARRDAHLGPLDDSRPETRRRTHPTGRH